MRLLLKMVRVAGLYRRMRNPVYLKMMTVRQTFGSMNTVVRSNYFDF